MFGQVEVSPLVDLQVTTVGPGTVEISPTLTLPTDAYLVGDTIQLTAIPDDPAGQGFAGWSGDLTGSDNPASLTLEKALTQITATFGPTKTLTVGIEPADGGQVELDPPGGVYGEGLTVSLTPVPNLNWAFDQWSGPDQADLVDMGAGTWQLVMDADKSVTANFVPCYTLTTTVTPAGSGTVDASPPPNCGTDRYAAGQAVQLTASPSTGLYFHHWTGDAWGYNNPGTIIMDSDKAVTAVFSDQPPPSVLYLPLIRRRSP